MPNFIVHTDADGKIVGMVELGMDEEDPCGECQDCYQLEQAMLAIIKGLRDEIAGLKEQVKKLEERPMITEAPQPVFDHLYRPWMVTYGSTTAQPHI